MSRALWLLTAALVALVGCTETVKPVTLPQVVRVEVPVYVPVPDALTEPCPIAEPESMAVQEAVKVANARKVALQNCNEDKAAIRALGQPPAK